MSATYDEGTIKTLDWQEHVRRRPGMYIGKLGDGTSADDGIYVLLKEVMAADPYVQGYTLINTWARIQAQELINSADDYF